MIIWLASYPRSGNTYFRMLLYHICGIRTYSIYDDPEFEEMGASEVVGHVPLPATPEELSRDEKVYFVKTHGLPSDNSPAIYLIRDGRDSLVSYARYLQSFDRRSGMKRVMKGALKDLLGLNSYPQILKRLIVNNRSYGGGWSNHVHTWTQRRDSSASTVTVKYEDLVEDPVTWLKKSIEDLQIQAEVPEFENTLNFDELHSRWPDFFRKGKIGSWREEMPEDLHELFWKHHKDAMEAFGYKK